VFSIRTEVLQTEGLAMDVPTSAILAQAYIQNMFKYVVEILIIYEQRERNIGESFTEFNEQERSIKFAMQNPLN
jgi:hypothetical protein